MREVRDEFGFSRLGPGVSEKIIRRLSDDGMGTLSSEGPYDLPVAQEERVFIYSKVSSFGKIVEAILEPTPSRIQRLQENASGDTSRIIERIRDLVCEASS